MRTAAWCCRTSAKMRVSLKKQTEKKSGFKFNLTEAVNCFLFYSCVFIETRKYGILEVDGDLRVLCMKEKPLSTETKSRRAVSSPQTLNKAHWFKR